MMVGVIFLLFLFTLALTVALPSMTKSIQQDRERETMRRGLQYRRGIQLYYRKFHAYPPSLEALVKTNNIRFLRKKYVDPTSKKEEWKPILFGQAKAPVAMGFFGQPMAGSTLAGTGPGGGNTPSAGLNGSGDTTSGTSSTGSGTSGSAFGSTSSTSSGASGSAFGSGSSTSSGTSGSAFGSSSSSSGSSSSSSAFGGGQTFGGAGIIGFEPLGTRQSILLYKKKNHYNEWEFTYDPISDQKKVSSSGLGTSAASTSSPIGSPSSSMSPSTPVSPSTPTTTQ